MLLVFKSGSFVPWCFYIRILNLFHGFCNPGSRIFCLLFVYADRQFVFCLHIRIVNVTSCFPYPDSQFVACKPGSSICSLFFDYLNRYFCFFLFVYGDSWCVPSYRLFVRKCLLSMWCSARLSARHTKYWPLW